jgi:hypothetical protein
MRINYIQNKMQNPTLTYSTYLLYFNCIVVVTKNKHMHHAVDYTRKLRVTYNEFRLITNNLKDLQFW